jgi:hypothetical protein
MDHAKEAIKAAYNDKRQKYLSFGKSLMIDGTSNSIDLYMQLLLLEPKVQSLKVSYCKDFETR